MKHPDVFSGVFPVSEVLIDRAETAARLHAARDFEDPTIDRCLDRLLKEIRYQYTGVRLPVTVTGSVCDFGFAKAESRNLAGNLYGCNEVFLFGVTTGLGVDRLLARLAALGTAEHFITDALSSAAAESLCEKTARMLAQNVPCRPRFSPGYGDLSLSFQRPLLQRIDAYERLGITLNNASLMTPMKSVTAIMGIEPTTNHP